MPFGLDSTFHLHGDAGSSLGDPFHDPGDLSSGLWGSSAHFYGHGGSSLGPEFLMNDSGDLSRAHAAATHAATASHAATGANSLSPTLVGAAGGLQFDLIWDSSVAKAPTAFESAIIAAAQHYATLFSNDEVVNIHVGYGEVGGSSMGSGALGESESYGYLTNYATVDAAMQHDASWSAYQKSADATLAASDPTHGGEFFVTSAEAKTLGLIGGASTAIDGYIGLGSAYSMDYATNVAGNKIGSNQFDAIAIAEHEISEVMGRIGSEGALVGKNIYTPLDLFRYAGNGVRDLTPTAGYFSVNGGATNLDGYNNPANGGDSADWAAIGATIGNSYDAYDAFTDPGLAGIVSPSDVIEDAALGYKLTSAGVAAA